MQKIDLNERLKKPAHARLPKEDAKDTGIARTEKATEYGSKARAAGEEAPPS